MYGHAQSLSDLVPDFSKSEQGQLKKSFGQYASSTVVFTGHNAASSGNFSFDNDGGTVNVTSIPFTHTFGDDGDTLRFIGRGAVGDLESRSSETGFSNIVTEFSNQLPPELTSIPNLPDFRKDRATSLSLGGGAQFEAAPGLTITPAFDFIWTHVKRKYDYNNFLSALFGTKYDRDLFNYSTETISYSPSMDVTYDIDLCDGYKITPSASYTHLWTNDIWSKSKFAEFSINSGVLQTQLAATVPLPYTVLDTALAVKPYVKRTNLYGAVRESLGDKALYDIGTDLEFQLKESMISALRIGAAFITADNLNGYRIDLGVDF